MYFRVAVHGISSKSLGTTGTLSVAVGDTFLFSTGYRLHLNPLKCTSNRYALKSDSNDGECNRFIPGICGDEFCVTHSIPYYQSYVGPGLEDLSAQRLMARMRNPHK